MDFIEYSMMVLFPLSHKVLSAGLFARLRANHLASNAKFEHWFCAACYESDMSVLAHINTFNHMDSIDICGFHAIQSHIFHSYCISSQFRQSPGLATADLLTD